MGPSEACSYVTYARADLASQVNNTTSPVASITSGTLGSYTHSFEFELEMMMAMDKDRLLKFCLYKPGDAANNERCMHSGARSSGAAKS